MTGALHAGLRALAHAESVRVRAASAQLGDAFVARAQGFRPALERAVGPIAEPPAGLLLAERSDLIGRALARAVTEASAPLLLAFAQEGSTAAIAEAERLSSFANTLDVLTGARGESALARRIEAVCATYTADAARPNVRPFIDVFRLADLELRLLDARVLSQAERLTASLAASAGPAEDVRVGLHGRAVSLLRPLMDAVDLYLDEHEVVP